MIRTLRMIIAVFAMLSLSVGLTFHLYNVDSTYNVKTDTAIIIVTSLCFILFGLSYIKTLASKPYVVSYVFKVIVTLWFIVLTAMNDFPVDYSYCLLLVVVLFSLIYTNTKGFILFFIPIIIVLAVLTLTMETPIVHLRTYFFVFVATGVLTYLILRSQEKMQKEFSVAQKNAQAIFHSAVGFFFFLDKDFKIISYNKFAEEIFKEAMHLEIKAGASIFNYFPPETHESFRTTLTSCMKGEIITNEKQVTFPHGLTVWVENTFNPVYDDNKNFLGIAFQTVRIDERKKIEEALRESEMKFSQMAANIQDGIWIGTSDRFIYMNDAFAKIWGRNKEEIMNNPEILGESIYPEDLARLQKNKDALKAKNEELTTLDEQYRILRPNGETRWIWARRFPVMDENGKPYRIVGINADITDKKNFEARLSQQNEFLQTLIDTIPNPIFYKDEKGRYLGCNAAFEKNIGGDKEKLVGKDVYQLSPKELADIYFAKDKELFDNPGHQVYEARVKYRDGIIRDVIFHKATFLKNDGKVGGLVGVILDITERKKFEEALQMSEQRFKEMANTLPLLVYEADEKGNITYFNNAGYSYTGYTDEDFAKGLTLPMMFPPGEMERAIENASKTMSGINVGAMEYTLKRKDGSLYTAIINTIPIMKDGKVVGRRGVVTDITDMKKAEEKIKASLKEKEVLLKEIHHRVKNNLQIISSMLRLQSDYVTDDKMMEVFREAQGRVLTMSLVHEKLYKAANFSEINISEYIYELVDTISSSFDFNEDKIKIKVQADVVYINIDTLIPLGLIINELLTNCLKHAFVGRAGGLIEVSFRKLKDGSMYLSVKDDGIGIDENIDFENIQSLGLRLVKILAEQINGELIVANHEGSSFTIRLKS